MRGLNFVHIEQTVGSMATVKVDLVSVYPATADQLALMGKLSAVIETHVQDVLSAPPVHGDTETPASCAVCGVVPAPGGACARCNAAIWAPDGDTETPEVTGG